MIQQKFILEAGLIQILEKLTRSQSHPQEVKIKGNKAMKIKQNPAHFQKNYRILQQNHFLRPGYRRHKHQSSRRQKY